MYLLTGIILNFLRKMEPKEKTETANSETMQNDRVEVLYFHGAQVCFPYKRL